MTVCEIYFDDSSHKTKLARRDWESRTKKSMWTKIISKFDIRFKQQLLSLSLFEWTLDHKVEEKKYMEAISVTLLGRVTL